MRFPWFGQVTQLREQPGISTEGKDDSMVVEEQRLDDSMHPGELMLPYLLPGRWA